MTNMDRYYDLMVDVLPKENPIISAAICLATTSYALNKLPKGTAEEVGELARRLAKKMVDIIVDDSNPAVTMICGKRFCCPGCGRRLVKELVGGAVASCGILSIVRDGDGDLEVENRAESVLEGIGNCCDLDYQCAQCGLSLVFDELETMVEEGDNQ